MIRTLLKFIAMLLACIIFYILARMFFLGSEPVQTSHYWFGFAVACFNALAIKISGVAE